MISQAAPRTEAQNRPVASAWVMNVSDPFTAAFFAHPGEQDPHVEPFDMQPAEPFKPRPPIQPSIFSGTPVAILLLVLGIAGWIALAVAAFMLDRRRSAAKPAA